MWLMLSDAFLSFVSKDCEDDELMVRARRPGDIEKVFPKARVTRYTRSDYMYRAPVLKSDVKVALSAEVDRVVYNNFKNSVRDDRLHQAYNQIWGIMAALQPLPPYSGSGRRDFFQDTFLAPEPKKVLVRCRRRAKAPVKLRKGTTRS